MSAIDRFTPQSERQFPKAEKTVAPPVAPPAAPQYSLPKYSPTPKVENVSEADAVAARKKELEQEQIDKDIKSYAIKKAQKEAVAKLAQRNK